MRLFRASWSFDRALDFIAASLGIRSSEPPQAPGVIIVPDTPTEFGASEISGRFRYWRANQSSTPDTNLTHTIQHLFDHFDQYSGVDITEATTRDWLITPVLKALDYYPWFAGAEDSGYFPDYAFTLRPEATRVALEAKRIKSATGDLGGPSGHKSFVSIAHQIVTYLDDCNFDTLLYSNGHFWWRLERDAINKQLHALRFNIRLARNEVINQQRTTQLARFVQIFHASAFLNGNNYAVPIRQGLGRTLEPTNKVGLVWMKDINEGYGNPSREKD